MIDGAVRSTFFDRSFIHACFPCTPHTHTHSCRQVNVKVISAKNMISGMKKKRELGAVATETMGRVMLSAMLVAHGVKVRVRV